MSFISRMNPDCVRVVPVFENWSAISSIIAIRVVERRKRLRRLLYGCDLPIESPYTFGMACHSHVDTYVSGGVYRFLL